MNVMLIGGFVVGFMVCGMLFTYFPKEMKGLFIKLLTQQKVSEKEDKERKDTIKYMDKLAS